MRWMLVLAVIAGCAHERPPAAPPPPRAGAPDSGPPEELLGVSSAAPSRSLAAGFETRRIGERPASALPSRAGRLVDIDVHDADVHDVLRLLADVGHVNIVVAGDVSGRVSMRLRRVPWWQALDAVTSAKGLAVAGDADLLIVTARK